MELLSVKTRGYWTFVPSLGNLLLFYWHMKFDIVGFDSSYYILFSHDCLLSLGNLFIFNERQKGFGLGEEGWWGPVGRGGGKVFLNNILYGMNMCLCQGTF